MDQVLDELFGHLRGIWLRRFWGGGAAWLVAVIGLIVTVSIPSKYEASARVFVNTESVLKPLLAGLAVQPNVDQQISILSGTLMSRPNVEKLVQLAGLDQGLESERERNALIDHVTKAVHLKSSSDNVFWLSYRDTDRGRAQRTVESLLSIFVESGLTNTRRDTDKAMAFLDAQIKEYEAVLSAAEQRLKQFKLQNLDQLASTQDAVGRMLALDGEIQKARTELRAAEQRRDALRRELASEEPASAGAFTHEDGLADIDVRAEVLRRNLDELLRKYTEEHPDVVGTRRILADLETERAAVLEARRHTKPGVRGANTTGEPNRVYQQLKVTLAGAEADVAALSGRLADLQNRYDRMRATAKLRPEFEEELAQLNREYQVQKTNFEQLVQRRQQAKLTGELDESGSVDFRVIDPPRASRIPVAPNRLLLALATLVLSLGVGVGFSFVVHRAYPTVFTAKELHTVSELPVLGVVSYVATPGTLQRRKMSNYAFAGGTTALIAVFGVALTLLLVATKMT